MTAGESAFWSFVRLRQDAYWRKVRGAGPPYSPDPALARYHFCNVYREADAGTVWFQKHRRRGGLGETLWSSILYRPVNRVATFERWAAAGDQPIPDTRSGTSWLRFLRQEMKRGEKIFTGRHLNKGLAYYARTVRVAIGCHEATAQRIETEPRLEAVTDCLREYPGLGPFFAWQVACDLMESHGLPWLIDDDEWALLGPGARRGALVVDPDAAPLDTARRLRDCQPPDLPEPPPQAPGPFSLKNVEHALCEYVRWVRASDPSRATGLEVKPWAK